MFRIQICLKRHMFLRLLGEPPACTALRTCGQVLKLERDAGNLPSFSLYAFSFGPRFGSRPLYQRNRVVSFMRNSWYTVNA